MVGSVLEAVIWLALFSSLFVFLILAGAFILLVKEDTTDELWPEK